MLDQLSISDFSPYLNQNITIRFAPGLELSATLIDARSWGDLIENQRQPFSLIFRAAQKNEYYPQAIYTLIHPTLGELPIFFVPLGPDAQGMRYEAVFN